MTNAPDAKYAHNPIQILSLTKCLVPNTLPSKYRLLNYKKKVLSKPWHIHISKIYFYFVPNLHSCDILYFTLHPHRSPPKLKTIFFHLLQDDPAIDRILTRYRHHVVRFGRACSAKEKFIFAADSAFDHQRRAAILATAAYRDRFIEHTYGTILSNAIRHFIWINPQSEFTWQKFKHFLAAQSDTVCCLPNQGIHFVVNPNASVS